MNTEKRIMLANCVIFTLIHLAMIVAGVIAYIDYADSKCKEVAMGRGVMTMSLLLVIVAPVMLLIHTCFFIVFLKDGKI